MTDAELAKDIVVTLLGKCDWGTPRERTQFAAGFVKACIAIPEKIPTEHLKHLAQLVHRITISPAKAAAVREVMDRVSGTKSFRSVVGRIWKAIEAAVNGDSGDDAGGSSAGGGVRG
jgi:hypothetical protein